MWTTPEEPQRSATELVIRTIATQIFALANYGHFGSLLNLPADLHTTTIIFLFYPSIITGQLVLCALQALSYGMQEARTEETNGATFSFYFHGILGVHATPGPSRIGDHDANEKEPIPLFQAGHLSVQRTTHRMSWKHLGRILLSFTVLLQAVGTTVLYVRRFTDGRNPLVFDAFNGLAAFCSTIVSVCSLAILLSRYEWRLVSPSSHVSVSKLQWDSVHAGWRALLLGFLWSGCLRGFSIWLWLIEALWGGWKEWVIVAILVTIFRKDIRQRLGLIRKGIGYVIEILSAIAMFSDVVSLLTVGIYQVKTDGAGWKDPWSDKLLVV